MQYPTMEEVNKATRYNVCAWHRFLLSPTSGKQRIILERIEERIIKLGGFSPEISKKLGWK